MTDERKDTHLQRIGGVEFEIDIDRDVEGEDWHYEARKADETEVYASGIVEAHYSRKTATQIAAWDCFSKLAEAHRAGQEKDEDTTEKDTFSAQAD